MTETTPCHSAMERLVMTDDVNCWLSTVSDGKGERARD